jgi:hypothetical protein
MTRSKTKPPIRKPLFDEENTIRFAAGEKVEVGAAAGRSAGRSAAVCMTDRKSAKKVEPDRLPLSLMLKPEVITRIVEEATRKGKSVEQIVEKLVAKHLGKH